jgi:hypothetical protein
VLKIDLQKKLWHFDLQIRFDVDPGQVMVLWGRQVQEKRLFWNVYQD